MEAFTSLSQGFTVQKPKRKPSKNVLDENALQYFADPLETAALRHRLYRENWQSFQAKIESFEENWNKELTKHVSNFITSNVPAACDDIDRPIPTAIMVTGLTEFENSQIFNSLFGTLQGSFPHTARVSSASCPNVKTAFQNIAKQLLMSNSNVGGGVEAMDVSESDNSDEDESAVLDSKSTKKGQISIHDLKTWHKSLCSTNTAPVVLILLEDSDLFPDGVTKDLLQLLSCCTFPLMLVLGVVNGFIEVENLVPSEMESRYKYKKYYSTVLPPVRLEKFLNAIILDWDVPFRVSGDIIRFMSEYFMHQQFSVKRLLRAYQFCLMEHFRSPVSTFCSPDLAGICDEVLLEYNEVFEQTVKSIPSWDKFIVERASLIVAAAESPSAKVRMSAARMTEIYPMENIRSRLQEAYSNFREWQVMLLIVYEMGIGLPESPIGTTLSQVYTLAWSGDINRKVPDADCTHLQKLLRLVGNFSRQEMDRRLSNALNRVNEFIKENKSNKVVKLKKCLIPKVLASFLTRLRAEPKVVKPETMTTSSNLPKKTVPIPTSTDWSTIRENLRLNIKTTNEDPVFNELRGHVQLFLQVNTKTKLIASPESSFFFAEVFTFSDVEYVRNQISPNVHKRIHTALCCPERYLKCECCKDLEPGSMAESLPDTSILYRLYLEQTSKRMNLNDMYMSFKSVVDNSASGGKPSSSKKAAQKQAQYLLRFKQAVAELEFMGFMKISKTKPDEAHKLTWAYSALPNED